MEKLARCLVKVQIKNFLQGVIVCNQFFPYILDFLNVPISIVPILVLVQLGTKLQGKIN